MSVTDFSNVIKTPEGEARLRRSFVGRFTPGDAPRNFNHAEGFDRALQAALDMDVAAHEANRAQLGSDVAKKFDVQVTFEATIEIASPGNVHEYRAVVVEL
jgi:hypothetical protein